MVIYPSGTIINNRYEIVQGPKEKPSLAGGMGLVYLCVDHAEDGKPVALKTFRPELLSNRAARDRFLREGTTWVELGKHPHIVHCYEVFKANVGSEVFFALELVAAAEGKADASLRSWLIPNEPLPLEQALLFALHICRGMIHATTMIPGMVHRDLKPENILIGRDGHARVTDFGLASAAQNLGNDWQLDDVTSSSHIRTQLTHGIAGTPLYMAPEQWAGEPLDERADIYAFGCILYEMLCGKFAVTGESIDELKEAHCQGRLKNIPTNLPDQLTTLMQRCLALNRVDRYPNWKELAGAIADVYASSIGTKPAELKPDIEDTVADQIDVGWSYNAMGISYWDLGKFNMAGDYFDKVLSIARQQSDHWLECTALGNLGISYHHLGDFHRAIEFHKQSLAIIRELGDRHGEGATLSNMGEAFRLLGSYHRAIELQERRIAIAREIGDRHGEGLALSGLGSAYFQLGDVRRAIEFYKQHLAIVRELGDRHGEGRALLGLGSAYCQLGNVRRAIECYEQDLSIARELGDRQGEGQALGNLGITYAQLGDVRCAIEFYEQYLAIALEIGDHHGEGQALGNLGNAYADLGDSRQAIECYEQRLAVAREIGDMMGEAETSLNMALILQQDRPSEALKYAKEALQIFNQVGHKQYAAQTQELINKIRGT